jgi:aminodeoxyfutalosine deaminase
MKEEYPSIIGIGLGGDERVAASEPFRAMYAEAKAAGLRLTNHAGETTGPEAIWEALSLGRSGWGMRFRRFAMRS